LNHAPDPYFLGETDRIFVMSTFTRNQWIAIVVPLAAAALTAVVGLWNSGGVTNTTTGNHSPIVSGNSGPVQIK
jgi:hypothetical protein